jgi:hypothetical protein
MKTHLISTVLATALFAASCGSGLDTGSANPTLPTWAGSRSFGIAGKASLGFSVAVDSSSNVYLAGQTQGAVDGQSFTGATDAILVKYDASGAKQWTRLLGGSGSSDTYGYGVAVDSSGNVTVMGQTSGNLGSNTRTGSKDLFAAQYDPSGNLLWVKQLGVVNKSTLAFAVAVGPSNTLYLAVRTDGNLDNQSIGTAANAAALVKYDSSGNKLWAKVFYAASSSTEAVSVAVDSSGNAYLGGDTDGNLGSVTPVGSSDGFLAKFDSSGALQWTRHQGATGQVTYGTAVAVASSGQSCITGYTKGQLDGQTGYASPSHYDLYVTCYDSSGTRQSTTLFGKSGADTQGVSLQIDSSQNIYVAGNTQAQLGSDPLGGTRDVMICKFNSAGQLQWVHQFGATGASAYWTGVAIDGSGAAAGNRIFVAGYADKSIGDITLSGTQDGILSLYSAAGVRQ